MALVKCPECKKKISDQCEKCPNCGYPIDKICEGDENQITDIENVDDGTARGKKSFDIKSLLKKWWFWVAVGVVIAAITTTTILLLNRDTEPKFDKEDNPVFVDFSYQVYSNPKDFLKQNTKIKGKIVNIYESSETDNLIEVKLYPTSLGDNILILYNSQDNISLNSGDYITCSGCINSINEDNNIILISENIKISNYIDVVDPPLTTTVLENITQTKLGCTISIEKIEHTPFETRIFISASNNTNTDVSLGISNSIITQQTTQKHYFKNNIEANYNIPFSVKANQSINGIIPFEPLQSGFECEFSLEVSSNVKRDNFIFRFDPY